jgi:predicted amidohydrolase
MKICVLTSPIKDTACLPECDLLVMGYACMGEVNYESELNGTSDKFGAVTRLSKVANCGVLCGCRTDSRGLKRKSVAVADRGKLCGIADMLHVFDGEQFKSGAYLGNYPVNGYRVGLCIENDLFFPENLKALSLVGCNLIVVFAESVSDNLPPLLIRAYAYLYGLPIVMLGGKVAYFADISGGIACSAQKISLFEVESKNNYRLVSLRQRGLFNDFSTDY